MVVTFEIKDVTQLVGQKQVDVKVTCLSADGSEMPFVSDLTKCVQDYSQNYKSKDEKK